MKNVVRVENGSMIFGQGGSGGSGGHTIQNDSGTALPQESALQFVGVYSEDDSTNHKTKVNIVREMTKAQMDALSTDAKKGVIHTTDEPDNPYEGDYIKIVYDQYFTLIGTGLVYIDVEQEYPMTGYKLIGLDIASNSVGYTIQARIRSASRITGFVQKANGGVIATGETIQIGVTLIYCKS